MTNEELRDAAVVELKLTTAGWRKPNGNPNYPSGEAPMSTHWGKAMNLLEQISDGVIVEPEPEPPTGDLRYRPPGWNGGNPTQASSYPGYTVVTANGGAVALNMDDAKDYFVDLGSVKWSSHATADTTGLMLNGGRNVVVVGGEVIFNSTNAQDDGRAIFVDGGDPAGIVHLEGLRVKGCNGITYRSQRILQVQNCRLSCDVLNHDASGGIHPDVIQVWRGNGRCRGIRLHRMSGFSSFTFLSDFTDLNSPWNGDQTPAYWELADVDLHPVDPNFRTGSGNNWMGHPSTTFRGVGWLDTTLDSAGNKRGLGDSLRQFGSQYGAFVPKDGTGISSAQYKILDASDAVLYTSPFPGFANPGGGVGKSAGHKLRYADRSEHPNLDGMTWLYGSPPEGNYVPDSLVGPSYSSPGYQ